MTLTIVVSFIGYDWYLVPILANNSIVNTINSWDDNDIME